MTDVLRLVKDLGLSDISREQAIQLMELVDDNADGRITFTGTNDDQC